MRRVIIRFHTILDLLDFVSIVKIRTYNVDNLRLTITGSFEEADIELAGAGYKAVILEDKLQGRQ